MTERARSLTFLRDEANHTLSSLQVDKNGYIGCFKDRADSRDLSGLYRYDINYRRPFPELCASHCLRYRYYALQNGSCFCVNKFGQYGSAPESDCQHCASNRNKFCGGNNRNSVYKNLRKAYVCV